MQPSGNPATFVVLLPLILVQAAVPVLGAATVDPIVRDGVRAGAYPGAVVAIGTADSVLYLKGYGRLTWSAASAVTLVTRPIDSCFTKSLYDSWSGCVDGFVHVATTYASAARMSSG